MKKIKIIIFDFDGVIADTIPYSIKKVVEISKLFKVTELSEKQIINEIRTKSYQELINGGMKIQWFKLPFMMLIIRRMQHKLFNEIETIKIFSGIKKTIKDLKNKGYKLTILSSNLEKNVRKFLELNKIDTFDLIHCGTHILGKSEAINSFLKKNNFNRNEVIYIGDEIRDVQACKKSGIKMIGVSWGLTRSEILQKYEVDYLANKPSDILEIIGKN